MAGFQSRARYVKRAVDEVLESDEDLSAMYITARANGRPRSLHDHVQLELLLESFVKQVEEIVSEVDTTVANMQSTQEIAELMLDSGRNALLALDIKVSIATLGVGTGALVAGFFGMNLATHLESTEYAFLGIAGGASVLGILVFIYGSRILRKVRRVALSGRAPQSLRVLAIPMRHQPAPGSYPRIHRVTSSQSIWSRIFKPKSKDFSAIETSDPRDPIWINEKADQARARDAFMAGWTGKSANAKDWEEISGPGGDEGKAGHMRIRWGKD